MDINIRILIVVIVKYLNMKKFQFFLLYMQGFGSEKAHLPEDCMLWSLWKTGILMGSAEKTRVLTLVTYQLLKTERKRRPLVIRMLLKIKFDSFVFNIRNFSF